MPFKKGHEFGKRFSKGQVPWNKGLSRKDDLRVDKIFETRNKRFQEYKHKISGPNNYQWKGNDASYSAIHIWIKRFLGKAKECMFNSRHKTTKYEWAHIYHSYSRNPFEYISLCPSCHRKYDSN